VTDRVLPAPAGFRWVRMATRLEKTLGGLGLPAEAIHPILVAHGEAGVHREAFLPPDEDHPDWLHPGRTLLVLVEDGQIRTTETLVLACGLDQHHPNRIPETTLRALRDEGFPLLPGGLGGRAEYPSAMGLNGETAEDAEADWMEAALALSPALLTLLVAEGLDQVRHLHLESPSDARTLAVRRGVTLFAPLADRIGGTLARRFRWWTRRVAPALAGPEFIGSS
jgi:hypothetical protein